MNSNLMLWITLLAAAQLIIYAFMKAGEPKLSALRERRPSEALSLLLFGAFAFGIYVLVHAISEDGSTGLSSTESADLMIWLAGAACIAAAVVMLFEITDIPVYRNLLARLALSSFLISPILLQVFVDGGLGRALSNLQDIPLLQNGDRSTVASLIVTLYYFFLWSVILVYLGHLWSVSLLNAKEHGDEALRNPDSALGGFDPKSLDRTVAVFSFGVALILSLALSGADFISLGIFSGLLAAGLSLSMRELLNNIAAGLILLWDESLQVDDTIELTDGTVGQIRKMTMRYTLVEDREQVETLIPNYVMVTGEIRNYSRRSKAVRLGVEYTIALDANVDRATEVAESACLGASIRVLPTPEPRTFVKGFTDWGIVLDIRFWISDPHNGLRPVQSDVLKAVARAFHKAGIGMPQPGYVIRLHERPDGDERTESKAAVGAPQKTEVVPDFLHREGGVDYPVP